jgi:hypothetical protein
MQVRYPDDEPVFDCANLVIRFAAEVDGVPVACAITVEALEDHFGASSTLEAALVAAFKNGRKRIESACSQTLEDSGGAPVVLHSGLFRLVQE